MRVAPLALGVSHMNKTFDLLVEVRDRMSLLIAVGAAVIGVTAVALYAYASGSLDFFQNLWSSIVIAFFGVATVVIYAAIDVTLLRKQQTSKLGVVRTPLSRVLAPLGVVLALIVFSASSYKHSAVVAKRIAHTSMTDAKKPRLSSVDDIVRECKFAKMKGYMDRGYSLLQADQAAYLECAKSNDKPMQLAQSLTSGSGTVLSAVAAADVAGLYGQGTLQNATALEWAAGSASDRLATSADFVRAVVGANDATDLQVRATELNACITEAVSGSPPPSLSAKDVAAACMVLLGYK